MPPSARVTSQASRDTAARPTARQPPDCRDADPSSSILNMFSFQNIGDMSPCASGCTVVSGVVVVVGVVGVCNRSQMREPVNIHA